MTDNNKSTTGWAQWVAIAGLLAVVTATALPLLHAGGTSVRWIYAAGAVAVFIGRLFNQAPAGAGLRVRRLYRMEVWAGIMFCVGAFFMFYTGSGRMDAMAFTLAGGAIEVYASLMIPRAAAADRK